MPGIEGYNDRATSCASEIHTGIARRVVQRKGEGGHARIYKQVFPQALLQQILKSMVHPDTETLVGSIRYFLLLLSEVQAIRGVIQSTYMKQKCGILEIHQVIAIVFNVSSRKPRSSF
ncbi:uncharacterized protein LOC124707185 [Lolium rigidum]|uniref:uncharacterized protein LOC124707185 n=1 Tax=Lolium rigidum TaxID=89674 RepID=UPI001F5CF132|nr:uncharacterized protein LOC124707185 [Lolium rigidum]